MSTTPYCPAAARRPRSRVRARGAAVFLRRAAVFLRRATGLGWRFVLALACLAAAAGPSWLPVPAAAAGCEEASPLPGEERLPAEQRALLAVARQLPLELKVGQLLMPGFVGTAPDPGLLDRARRGHVGGFFFLVRNVVNAAQVQSLTAQLSAAAAQGSAGIQPLLATDFEGGTVNALRPVTGNTPSAAQLAAGGVAGVEARGAQDAATLKSLGFTTDLAPVADVLAAPGGVIGTRSFSSDPATAAALSRAYLRGLQGAGVLGVMKHFPGHGATSGDSHVLLPTVGRSLAQLEAADLVPYRQAFGAGEAQAVMVGHLLMPAIDPDLPTSLSPGAVSGLLRDRLGFDGLVLTDELKMGAISQRFGVAQAAVMAIQAGVDVILADYTGAEQDAVSQALQRACLAGQIAPGRLEQSVARVLRVKLAYGLAGPDVTARYASLGGQAPAATSVGAAARPPDLGGVALAGLPDGAAGRWYAEAAGQGDFGFAVTDEAGIGFWQSYAAGGGPARFGYPISGRFEFDGRVAQATQRALLVWDPAQRRAVPQPVFEVLQRAGSLLGWPGCDGSASVDGAPRPECSLDNWLEQQGVPAAIAVAGANGDDRQAVATRLSWLENDLIRAAFLASPGGGPPAPWPGDAALAAGLAGTPDDAIPSAAIERYGLPMSRPVRFGPFLAQRFQYATLQLWLDQVDGMPAPGTVVEVLAGEVLREAGLIPPAALVPATQTGDPGEAPSLPPPPGPPAPAESAVPAPAAPAGESAPPPAPAAQDAPAAAAAATPAVTPAATSTATPVSPQPTPTRPPATPTAIPPTPPPATSTPSPAATARR